MSDSAQERIEQLGKGMLAPLVLGGPLTLQRPLGARLAIDLAANAKITDDELRFRVEQARLRRARSIVPVDVLGDPDTAQWCMVGALNDFFQATNDELSNFATRDRHARLLTSTMTLLERIPPPRTLYDAVARHATFGRLLRTTRTDSRISWWTGSAVFRGRPVPPRLHLWPKLRRVKVETKVVPLPAMADDVPGDKAVYDKVLTALLACSPVTDLVAAGRARPSFAWSPSSLALVSTLGGMNLTLRAMAVDRGASHATVQQLHGASQALPAGPPRDAAIRFVQQLSACLEQWLRPGHNSATQQRA